jgi:hypothetical protein
MIELSRTQDEEVGDGTTTVIILGMHTIFVYGASTDRLQLVRFLHRLCRNWSEISTLL